ncbi:MAG: hypothetical protein IPM92_13915 [Saprospiraceae bacterium]|nr:hypothetical protein [Saprospiraceae bacterium]
MFPSVSYPEFSYQKYNPSNCPYSFRFADYIQIETDTTFFNQKLTNSCWLNLQIPAFNGTLHCSYYSLNSEKELEKYIKDAYKLAREHQKKANYIDELALKKPNSVYGMVFNIEGPAASPLQFYLTDSSKHFFRASLYFKSQSKPDSLLPIVEFVKKDILETINSFEWK